ncbi:Vq motif-containing protein [Thalictrum thalictroides]|uniref:Vq motif-containing protein n=1 Tax=Thalictrum thalictroides TaxID=46969 RepID=A0A7J6VPE5_THATH|nr:Vq motif-containing protein [Thalictrum thalictroides]
MGSSSSSSAHHHEYDVNRLVLPIQNPSSSSSMSLPPHQVGDNRPSSSSDQTNVVLRQSKKRSRASRRAPTTVLTTDTSNFRAMVQEFTGIPAPPFSASPFPRSRLDFFNTAARVGHLEATRPPPYLLRPFAQKPVHQQPLPFAVTSSSTPGNNVNNTSNSTSTPNYQLLSELGLSKQSQNLVNNMQNPLLTFQSLLQSTINNPQKFQLPNSLSSFPENSHQQQQGIGGLEEFNVNNHGQVIRNSSHLNDLPNFVTSSDGSPLLRNDHHHNNASDHHQGQLQLRSFNENYERVNNNCKVNYTASSSQDKGSENNVINTSRGGSGEGMVDSWICSSD